MRKQVPPRDLRWIDDQGRPTDQFFDFIKNLDSRTFPQQVANTEAADTEVMIFNSTTGVFEPGAN